jgi:hypothetical protein
MYHDDHFSNVIPWFADFDHRCIMRREKVLALNYCIPLVQSSHVINSLIVDDETIHVNPHILFERLTSAGSLSNDETGNTRSTN